MIENQLVKIVNESGLEKSKAQVLLERFSNYFEIASDWERKAKKLIVSDESQKTEMKMAREARLFLKEKRVDVEKTRKTLKEQSLREGQTIDAIAKILTNLIAPIEKHLEQQEKFAEIQIEKRRIILKTERENEIREYMEFVPVFSDITTLSEDDYQKLLNGAKLQYQAKIEAEQRAENERIAKEKAEAEEREQIKIENERLKKEREESERLHRIELERLAKERADAEKKEREEREAAELKLRAEKEKAEAEARMAREEAEKIERQRAEELARIEFEKRQEEARIEKDRKDAELAANKAAAAPDKEKLLQFANELTKITVPKMNTESGIKIAENTATLLWRVVKYISDNANEL